MLKIQEKGFLKRTVKIFIGGLIICIIATGMTIFFSPSIEQFESISGSVPSALEETTGLAKVWQYVLQNGFKVPLQMLILALIPIPFLYLLNIGVTEILFGVVIGFAVNIVPKEAPILLFASIPHFIFELFGLCLVASGLYMVNKSLIRKISNFFKKDKKTDIPFIVMVTDTIKIYIFFALPCIIIAAFLETYFTDFIMKIML